MKIKPLVEKFNDCGCIVFPTTEQKILDLPRNEIIRLFEKYGVIIFKDFGNMSENILEFSNSYTLSYANDAQRREKKMGSDKLHGVDGGNMEMPMHSEASYSPAWPEIIWFYCIRAPKKSGKTTLCDGRLIFKKMSLKTKNFFLKNQILYNLKIPFDNKSGAKSKIQGERPWYIESQGIYDCKINFSKNEVYMKQKRYAVQPTRTSEELAFCNHLQIILDRDPQVLSISLEDGSKIPEEHMQEVKRITKELTVKIDWCDNDFAMIDNRRFMHGRTEILEDEKREIINIQTLKTNFGFGESKLLQIVNK